MPKGGQPLPVGVVPWEEERERTTVAVKCTYVFDPYEAEQQLLLSRHQFGFTVEGPARGPGVSEVERSAPTDLVRDKLAADVLLKGHAYGAQAQAVLPASIRLDDLHLAFTCVGPSPIEKMPLASGYLRGPDGKTPIPPVGAIGPRTVSPAEEVEPELTPAQRRDRALRAMRAIEIIQMMRIQHEREMAARRRAEAAEEAAEPDELEADEVDLIADEQVEEEDELAWEDLSRTPSLRERGTQYAAAHLTCSFPAPDAVIELEGLTRSGGKSVLRLPNHRVLVVVEGADELTYDVEMTIDTIVVDTDTFRVSVVWRGQAPEDVFDLPDARIIVALAPDDAVPPLHDVYRHLPRGWFSRAAIPPDAEDILPPDEPDVGLEAARLMTMRWTPDPLLDLEGYARLRAELTASPSQRKAILERHGFDEDGWQLEERAWLDVVGKALAAGELDEVDAFNKTVSAALERTTAMKEAG
jgi:hypothetical protein